LTAKGTIEENLQIATLQATYAEQVAQGLSWGATWFPSSITEVGDVGTFVDGVFVKATDLALLQVAFATEPSSYDADLDFSSQKGVTISAKTAGQTSAAFQSVAKAQAGIAVSFQRDAGVVMSLSGLSGTRIENRAGLEEELSARLKAKKGWSEDYAVVVEVMHADSATILLSREAGTKVEFETKADIQGAGVPLGALSAGVSLAYADAMAQLLVAKSGLTPLLHTLRLKEGFWTGKIKTIFDRIAPKRMSAPRAAQWRFLRLTRLRSSTSRRPRRAPGRASPRARGHALTRAFQSRPGLTTARPMPDRRA
jgi:hypothetical protein